MECANKFIKNVSGKSRQCEESMNNEGFNRNNRKTCLLNTATTIHKYCTGQIDELPKCYSSLANSKESCCFPKLTEERKTKFMRKHTRLSWMKPSCFPM